MIKILITGDLCPVNRIEHLAKSGNFKSIFNDFITVTEENDLNITNLECPLYNGTNNIKKRGPSLKAKESLVKILTSGNFNLATLANNHLMDFGEDGLNSTIGACKRENISIVGAGSNLKNARIPFYKKIKDKTIAIINIAENEFATTQNERPGANPLNPVTNYYDIKDAKSKADFVFVIVHGGHELYRLPSPRMQEIYRFMIDAGADSVVGHHTHCYSGYEIYHNKPIFYSLGNFLFDWPEKRSSIWNSGYALQFIINDENIDFKLHPYIQGDIEPGVRLMNDQEKDQFKNQLLQLNLQIGNSEVIALKFEEFLNTRKRNYLSHFEPYTNKFLVLLYNKGLLPSLVTGHKKRLLLNIIRCEAHRDLLIKTLSNNP